MRHFMRTIQIAVIALVAWPAAADDLPQATSDGLVRVQDGRAAIAYVRPDANWVKFKSVEIQPLVIPAKVRNTAPKGERPGFGESFILKDEDVAAIQKAYSDAMTKELTKAGFAVVDAPRGDTLVIAAQLIDITLNAPIDSTRATMMGGVTLSQGAGSMAIEAVLADGTSGTVVAEAADRKYGHSMWGINNRASNMFDAQEAFRGWGRELAQAVQQRAAGKP